MGGVVVDSMTLPIFNIGIEFKRSHSEGLEKLNLVVTLASSVSGSILIRKPGSKRGISVVKVLAVLNGLTFPSTE
jgi:hypothetical protein